MPEVDRPAFREAARLCPPRDQVSPCTLHKPSACSLSSLSNPHPFVSLITPIKGKKLLPRVARLLDNQRMQIILTLIVACFSQLDVIVQAPLLDTLEETREVLDLEGQTQAFLSSVVQSILPVIAKAQMRLITGLFGLLLESNNVIAVARTRVRICTAIYRS